MAAPILLISIFSVAADAPREIWNELKDHDLTRYLISPDRSELLQLRGYPNLSALAAATDALDADLDRFAPYMTGDVRRELLRFVEAPKPSASPLPQTDYVQLRHVEVPPTRQPAYRAWREQTIFEVVRTSPAIDSFLAYHSLISGQPGVMFVAGFSGDSKDYLAVFDSPRYRDIVQQAGDKYITGGSNGLYTRLYVRPQLAGGLS